VAVLSGCSLEKDSFQRKRRWKGEVASSGEFHRARLAGRTAESATEDRDEKKQDYRSH